MIKLFKNVLLCALAAAIFWSASVVADRQKLNEDLIRLHVVADSDDPQDQHLKLKIRDAVIEMLTEAMENIPDVQQAKAYLADELPQIQKLAEKILREAGCQDAVSVSLEKEAFDTRHYDTFSLPAGVYEALRITVGSGEGQNWWCVVFPTLCMGAASDEFEDTAAGAGFSDSLTDTLEGKKGYELRFFLLDVLGELENLLRFG